MTFCNRTITSTTVDSGSSMDCHDKATHSVHRPAELVSVPNRLIDYFKVRKFTDWVNSERFGREANSPRPVGDGAQSGDQVIS